MKRILMTIPKWITFHLVFLSAITWAEKSAPIVLKAAHLFDSKSGVLKDPGTILVHGERIVSIGSLNSTMLPPNAQVIDLGNATLLPGFIDAHVHLSTEYEHNFYRGFYNTMLRFPVEQAHYAARFAKRTLEAGFTTVRNLGSASFIDVGLRNSIDAGVIPGPTMITGAHSIGSTGGHCDISPFPPEVVQPFGPTRGICNGPEECRAAVRYQMKWGANVIKICSSGGVLSESDPVDVPQLTPAELGAIVNETHAWKLKVAAHSHGDLAARLAVEAGVDSIEHGSFLTEPTLRLMKEKNVYLVPTRLAVYWVNKQADTYPAKIAEKARNAYREHGHMMKAALKIGVRIAFGTDSGVSPHGTNAKEFGLLAEVGMSPSAILTAATLESAKLLGIDDKAGTLEAGKYADVVAVPGNVLQDITATERVLFVMKHGNVVFNKK